MCFNCTAVFYLLRVFFIGGVYFIGRVLSVSFVGWSVLVGGGVGSQAWRVVGCGSSELESSG